MSFLTLNVNALAGTIGYLGLFGIILAESGLMVGFFLPGDSLLFTAGFLASQGYFSIKILIPLFFVAAILGDNLGYWIGHFIGPKLFTRKDSFFFRQEYAARAKAFFEKFGAKAVVMARFVPVVRAFVPVMAGIGKMNYKLFFLFDIIGGILWAIVITLLGYYLGGLIPNIDKYILPIVAVIVIVSLIPTIREVLKMRKAS